MKIANYQTGDKLFQGKKFTIYRAVKEGQTDPFVLKVLEKKTASLSVLDALDREYRFLQQIDSPYVNKVIEKADDKVHAFIVLEDISGESIKDHLKETRFSIEQFLRLAVFISEGLAAIHRQNIIHKDINPGNIIWNPRTGDLKIIDMDIASIFDIKISFSGNPEKLHGTLPYVSPEQTGRMNRTVDYRTDLYSLGVTFYEMLTGKLPFRHSDPMKVIYDHLARDPEPPHLLEPQVPEVLSELVLKLMAKNAEDRYQSAEGLKRDLEKLEKTAASSLENIKGFSLGEKDFSGKLQIPERLYGRRDEIKQLLDTYSKVSKGAKEMVMVAGYSGTGKTALVSEIHPPITRNLGVFVSGKFDQLQRTIPYFAFIQALDQLCRLILTENREELSRWKNRILKAVGKSGRVLTDIIPQLESVIGPQPEVPAVGADEARKRFNYVFQQFIQAVSTKEHPLVMFIDDLQWADLASLDLLQVLMADKKNRYILFIGSYRDNEVSHSHPLVSTIEELQKQDIVIHTIPVKNLSVQNVQDWLCDTLKTCRDDSKEVEALTGLIYEKTQGNAFFTVQFLKNLYQEDLLRFDHGKSAWTWNIKDIQAQNITDNVVDLLVRRIRTLPREVQEVLKLSSCVGNVFDLETLAVISGQEQAYHKHSLQDALAAQLIVPEENGTYKFIHDRIHQAAYSLIDENDKKPLHLKIGRLLLKTYNIMAPEAVTKDVEKHLFDIVNHLNTGIQLIDEQEEKIQLAGLNLKAGQNAKMSAAYKLGADYIKTALDLLPGDRWASHYELTLALYNEAVQASFLCGDYDAMEEHVETVLRNTSAIEDKTNAYEYRLQSYIMRNLPHLAADAFLSILKDLGINIPKSPGMPRIMGIVMKTQLQLKLKGKENVIGLPAMTDPRKLLAMRLFAYGIAGITFGCQELLPYAVSKIVGVTLKYGLTPVTPFVFTYQGSISNFIGNIRGSYEASEISMSLITKMSSNEIIKARSIGFNSIFSFGWKMHYKEVAKRILESSQISMDSGDFEFVGFSLANYILYLSRTDMEISLLYEKAKSCEAKMIELDQRLSIGSMHVEVPVCEDLLSNSTNPSFLSADVDALARRDNQESTVVIVACFAFSKQVFLAFLFEKFERMPEYIAHMERNWKLMTTPLIYVKNDVYFYVPLGYLQLYTRTRDKKEKKKYLRRAKKYIKTVKKWAEFGPVNFLHKYLLMLAELYRVTGKTAKAAPLYDQAIEKAYENEYVHEAGIANELAAKFYLENLKPKLAAFYFSEAMHCYRKWGAAAKIKHLEEAYPKYISAGISERGAGTSSTISSSSSFTNTGSLDIKSILNASQTLSGEVQLQPLLEKMMRILIENAGAQKGVLIENAAGHLLVQAEGDTDGVSGVLQKTPAEESGIVPTSVINYVARSKEQLVFDNLSADTQYSTDDYIQNYQPKSAVCFPVLSKGDLSAIIYLENNRVEGAFTPARLEVLNILSAQIAISMENTYLYENLEEKVQQRTIELENANRELEENHKALEESHKKINDSVNYASKIQEAVLPSGEALQEFLPRHFLFFRPCSVVSGDFYWVKEIDGKIVVASADCTGHGVPGALLSMLGSAFLNELVPSLAARSQLQADAVLNRLRNEVKIALKQKDTFTGQKEGMDIGLCIIDPQSKSLQFAGAYHSLYLIHDNKLDEIKGDRMPIGVYRKESPFTNHRIDYHDGQMLYLSSDGYADQMSEETNEKFMKKNFRKLLVEINQEPVANQEKILIAKFEEWQGAAPQVDDVLVLGIRL